MPVHHHNENGGAKENHSPSAQLKAAAEILEKAAANRALLAGLPEQERMRLLKAAGEIYCPDVNARRRLVKAKVRQRKAEKIQRDQSKLNKTGIRKLRREKVFTTPNLISKSGDIGWKFSDSICATRQAWKRFADICSQRARVWISSSTTPARPCGGRRIFTST